VGNSLEGGGLSLEFHRRGRELGRSKTVDSKDWAKPARDRRRIQTLPEIRGEILREIDRRRDEFIELCAEVVRHPTENPPGDTAALADFVAGWLRNQGIDAETVEPKPTWRSLLSTFNRDPSGRLHFMFNGHFDIFPSGDHGAWKIPPFEGRVSDGKIHGRGVADMKGGLTASIIAYGLLSRYRESLPARVSLMIVADEETGGSWGTKWILENLTGWLPDACLIGEPCSPDAVRIGEKGVSWIRVTIAGRSYHGSLGMADNCILQMSQALLLLKDVTALKPEIPERLRAIIETAKTHNLNDDTRGRESLLERPSFNVGRIEGGLKVNVAPPDVTAEVDIRVPFGITPAEVLTWTKDKLNAAGLNNVALELTPTHGHANYTDPEHPFAQVVAANATEHYGKKPTFTITTAATDGRHFRYRGVPTIIYGPRPQGIGGVDEHITVEDFIAVLKVHACAALDYIQKGKNLL
jgi:succinyl-diaminopimelate desuccinylase